MSSRLTPLDWTMLSLIALFTLFHAAMLAGVFRSEDAIAGLGPIDLESIPRGNAPGLDEPTAADLAEADASASLPGRFVASQGKQHVEPWPLRRRVPYCSPGAVSDDCYASRPPTSGLHVPVQRAARLSRGVTTLIPPDPGIYEFDLPREVVPHIQEHAGVFVGYNCASDGCRDAVKRLRDVVGQELSIGGRIVMTPFSDLDPDTIALASWTRVDTFDAASFDPARVRDFIKAHSCRYDPEDFCRNQPRVS